jgi:ATP-dependent helicase/nuclease subunit B
MPIILTKNFQENVTENFLITIKKLVDLHSKDGDYRFIHIVPTRRRVRELQRELIEDISFGKLPIYTLELLAQEIFSLAEDKPRIILPSTQGMMIGKILLENNFKFFKYDSSYFDRGKIPAGTIKKIVDQIDYLRENGIRSHDFEKMILAAGDSEKEKLQEFLLIYKEYEKELGKDYIDTAGLLSAVNDFLASSKITELLLRVTSFQSENITFLVEGFYNFKKPELEFLRILSSNKNLPFLIKLDCDESNVNLFRSMLTTVSDLKDRGFKIRTETIENTESATKNGSRAAIKHTKENIGKKIREYFASNLFSESVPTRKLDLVNEVTVVSACDKIREVEFVAEKVKEIVKAKPNQKLDSICVASYLPQDYSQAVREVFAKYKVPINVTDRYTLESNNVINGVLSFIDIKLRDYERGILLRAVTNRILTVTDEIEDRDAGSILYNAAVLCRFERGLKHFKETISSRLQFLSKLSNEDIDSNESLRSINTLTKAQKLLDSIEQKLAPFKKETTPLEFINAVKALVEKLQIRKNIVQLKANKAPTEIVERDARALSTFFKVLDEIAGMNDQNAKVPLETMMEKLRAALSMTRYNIRQKHGYGVYVTALEEMRGLEFDYVFIIGLNEGEFPARYTPDIFLPISSQKENRDIHPYLQRHLFYQAISSFREKLFLVYAMEADGVRLLRSSFLDELEKIADVSSIDERDIRHGLQKQPVYNTQQLILQVAPVLVDGRNESIIKNQHLLPPNLLRCIKAEAERYKDNIDSEFHGKINQRDLIDSISKRLTERVFSSSQIEALARCGFQFFANRILQISETPDVDISFTMLERGAVIHKILFKFYKELSDKGNLDNATQELPLLIDIGRRVLDELEIEHDLFEVEKATMLGEKDIPGMLELFLKKVQSKLYEFGFHPRSFEVEFGMSSDRQNGKDGYPTVKLGRDVMIRGKIDRIDLNTDGFWVFDYKTSNEPPSHKDVLRDKISPQLLLYISALSEIVASEKIAGAAFISINRDKLLKSEDGADLINFIVQPAETGGLSYNKKFASQRQTNTENYPKTIKELLKETASFVSQKVSEARDGRFNLTRFDFDRVCKFCPYSQACRVTLRERSL